MFELTENQYTELNNWLIYLKEKYGKCGQITYSFTLDGLGGSIEVKSSFGDKKDLTEWDKI